MMDWYGHIIDIKTPSFHSLSAFSPKLTLICYRAFPDFLTSPKRDGGPRWRTSGASGEETALLINTSAPWERQQTAL